MTLKEIRFCKCEQPDFYSIFRFIFYAEFFKPYRDDNKVHSIINDFFNKNGIDPRNCQASIILSICRVCYGFNDEVVFKIFQHLFEEEVFNILLKRIIVAQKEKLKEKLNEVVN